MAPRDGRMVALRFVECWAVPRIAHHFNVSVETILDDGVPGDLIETGVWRGGATIFMRAILKVRDVTDRFVWVADSFAGLPAPDLT